MFSSLNIQITSVNGFCICFLYQINWFCQKIIQFLPFITLWSSTCFKRGLTSSVTRLTSFAIRWSGFLFTIELFYFCERILRLFSWMDLAIIFLIRYCACFLEWIQSLFSWMNTGLSSCVDSTLAYEMDSGLVS